MFVLVLFDGFARSKRLLCSDFEDVEREELEQRERALVGVGSSRLFELGVSPAARWLEGTHRRAEFHEARSPAGENSISREEEIEFSSKRQRKLLIFRVGTLGPLSISKRRLAVEQKKYC